MPIAGYSTALRASGASNVVTGEATTSLGGGVYQVTSSTRRIWDPAVTPTVKDGGTPVASTFWTFDYLFGKVTFSGYSPGGAVTIDGSYLSMVTVLEGHAFEFSVSRDLADSSEFGSAWKKKTATMGDVSCSFESHSSPLVDLDAGVGGVQSLDGWLQNGTPKVFEVNLNSGAQFLRAWVQFESEKVSAAVADLVGTTIAMQGAEQRVGAAWGFGT